MKWQCQECQQIMEDYVEAYDHQCNPDHKPSFILVDDDIFTPLAGSIDNTNLKRLIQATQMIRLLYNQDNKPRLEDWIAILEEITQDIVIEK